jgi:hypothetical protein
MKTERRHELAKNDLADWMGDKIEELKPYSTAIWGTVFAAIAVVLAIVYWSRKSEAQSERTWDSYFNARNEPDSLRNVAEAYPKSPAGLWSRLTLGDLQLAKGVDALFEDRTGGQEALKEAAEAYEFVIHNAPRGSLLVERATFGLGEVFESQNELDKARSQYEDVVTNWPDGAFSAQAKQRLADLDKPATKQFYDWFAKQEPRKKPAASSSPTGGKLPFDASKLEEHPFQPQIKLDSNTFGGSKGKKAKPAGEEKDGDVKTEASQGDAEPAGAKPSDEQPSEAKKDEAAE